MFQVTVFYRYTTVDLMELAENLGDRARAAELAGSFLQAFALALPSGKRTATAPHTLPALVYAVGRTDRPVNFAAAFEDPVRGTGQVALSVQRLAEHARRLEDFLGEGGRQWHAHATTVDVPADADLGLTLRLPELAAEAGETGAC